MPNPTFALMIQPEITYGIKRLAAHIVIPQPDGELHNPPSWDWYSGEPGSQYNGFSITAYVGDSVMSHGEKGKVWGFTHQYSPFSIKYAGHAQAIAKVLLRVQRHLEKTNTDDGYLSDTPDDFARYVMRVAAVLKIRDIYTRNTVLAREMSGEKFRKVTGSGLQSWVAHTAELIGKGELSQLEMV